jgi:hypothetical protein
MRPCHVGDFRDPDAPGPATVFGPVKEIADAVRFG